MRHELGVMGEFRPKQWEFSDALWEWFALYNGEPAVFIGLEYTLLPRIASRWADCHAELWDSLTENVQKSSHLMSSTEIRSGELWRRTTHVLVHEGLDVYQLSYVPRERRALAYVRTATAAIGSNRRRVIATLRGSGTVVPCLAGPSDRLDFGASFMNRVEVIDP